MYCMQNCLEGLAELRQCPLGDLPQCPEWSVLKEGLVKCLANKDRHVVVSTIIYYTVHNIIIVYVVICYGPVL